MSNLSPLSVNILQNTVNTSQQQINDILKKLQSGLSINKSGDDPANLYISENLNMQALNASSASSNAQSGLNYLHLVETSYDTIITELTNIKNIANAAMGGTYNTEQLQAFQEMISDSVNKIKNIEENTTFNGVNVFDNENSAGLVNEHMFAITAKNVTVISTLTSGITQGDYDYKSYLTQTINRYTEQAGGILSNGIDPDLTIGANVITIKNASELVSALDNQSSLGKTYVLTDNIDLSSLGTQSSALLRGNFEGTFLGNGYAIKGLEASSNNDYIGLFESISGGTVKDLILKDFNVQSTRGDVGALAGGLFSGAIINNIAVLNATINAGWSGGGLIGVNNNGSVTNSYSTGTVTGDASSDTLGGLVGHLFGGSISQSFSTATVTGGTYLGGLVGNAETGTTVSKSYATGDVTGTSQIGGLLGACLSGSVTNSYALGTVLGTSDVGGLVGFNDSGTISSSYSMSQTVSTGANYQLTALGSSVGSMVGTPSTDYNQIRTVNGKTYAFSSSTDATNFNDGKTVNGDISKFYEYNSSLKIWEERKAEKTISEVQALGSGYDANHIIHNASEFVSKISADLSGSFIMVSDIDFSSLGTLSNSAITGSFSGNFNGNGYSIKNLTIDTAGASIDQVGLFSDIGTSSPQTIKNFYMENVSITATDSSYVGAVIGFDGTNTKTFDNIHVSGSITAKQIVGGLIGKTYSTVSNSSSSANVTGTLTCVGGLVGDNQGTITKSMATGTVTGLGAHIVGGLAGANEGTISESSSAGTVSSTGQIIGGLVGSSYGTVTNSSSSSNVTGAEQAGGFIGWMRNTGSVTNSYSTGNVTATVGAGGGFAGQSDNTTISNCYTTSNVTSPGAKGGFSGSGFSGNTNFYLNNMSYDTYDALNANPATGGSTSNIALATSTWGAGTWNYTADGLPTLSNPLVSSKPLNTSYDYSYTAEGGSLPDGTYYFTSATDRDNFAKINNGDTTDFGDINTYKFNSTTGNWDAFKVSKTGLNAAEFVGTNTGTVTSSFQGTGAASAITTDADGAYLLGNTQIANLGTTPLNSWTSNPAWNTTGARPLLTSMKAEGSENIIESTLPRLQGETGLVASYTNQFSYSSDSLVLNTALTDYTTTVKTPTYKAFTGSISETDAIAQGYDSAHIIHDASEFVSKIQGHESEDFILVNNIDMSTLGTLSNSVITNNFTGDFDGNGYKIQNLTIDTHNNPINRIGLFSRIDLGATVRNVGIENVNIHVGYGSYVGALAGQNEGASIVDNCYSTGNISVNSVNKWTWTGGLIGANEEKSTIKNSYSSATVSGYLGVGGIAGANARSASGSSIISNCYFTGNVTGVDLVGGIAGINRDGGAVVENCYSTGIVTGTGTGTEASYHGVGGIVGSSDYISAPTRTNSIINCYAANGIVSMTNPNTTIKTGGVIGNSNYATVTNSFYYNNGQVSDQGGATSGIATGLWDSSDWNLNTTAALPLLRKTPTTFITETQAIANGYDSDHIIHNANEFVSKIQGHETENFIMVGDLDMSSLGTFANSVITADFSGELDGNGYKIKNLKIDTAGAAINNIGLFSYIDNGVIKNLGIENININATNSSHVGGIAGYSRGGSTKILNSLVSGTIKGKMDIGGIVGQNQSLIQDCASYASVTGSSSDVGGIAGVNNTGKIINCYATGNIKGVDHTGGLVGYFQNSGIIQNSYATGDVNGRSQVGGLVGWATGTAKITNSYAAQSSVIGSGIDLGGFVGSIDPTATADASNFYKNNLSTTAGNAIDGNISALPTSSWDTNVWGSAPALIKSTTESIKFATDKLISNIKISNADNPNQSFTEGEDFIVYTNTNGATWKIDILSSAMVNKNIKIDYEGVPTGTANQSISGFNMYMGENKNLNIKDMSLDFAGRLNFNITQNSAQNLLDSVNDTLDYMNIKKLRLDGSLTLAENALDNKTSKNKTLATGSKTITGADKAKETAFLLKEQLKLQTATDLLTQFFSSQYDNAKSLLGSDQTKGKKDYFYKNLYDTIK